MLYFLRFDNYKWDARGGFEGLSRFCVATFGEFSRPCDRERPVKAKAANAKMADMAETAIELCRALVRCPSVTPQDAGAQGVLQERLRAAGFTTHSVAFAESGAPDVVNLYARIGAGRPHLAFAGHTDVVPPGDAAGWRFDPFSAECADGVIFGRGVADMKGAIAAFVAAACAFVASHGADKGSISLIITGDEEGPAINGTDKLLRWAHERGERFDHCIVGEPTNPDTLGEMVKIGRRGSLNGTLSVKGRQGHAAYPHRANNPIPHLLRLLGALIAAQLDSGTDHFDASNLEIVSVDVGNPAFNVIPAEARGKIQRQVQRSLDAGIARRRVAQARRGGGARRPLSAAFRAVQRFGFSDAARSVHGTCPWSN